MAIKIPSFTSLPLIRFVQIFFQTVLFVPRVFTRCQAYHHDHGFSVTVGSVKQHSVILDEMDPFGEYLDAKLFAVCYMLSRYHVHDVVHRFGQPLFGQYDIGRAFNGVVILFLIFSILPIFQASFPSAGLIPYRASLVPTTRTPASVMRYHLILEGNVLSSRLKIARNLPRQPAWPMQSG